MRRLSPHHSGERGASSVIAAIFLASVMLAAGLLTIDVGRFYMERRQLQNGADAAALAVAQTCATNPTCDPSVAASYANGNANDATESVAEICGTGTGLTPCTSPVGGSIANCPGYATTATAWVQVRTNTLNESGSVIRTIFGDTELTITACARAALGGVVTATGIAFTVSHCEWQNATGGGATYGDQVDLSLTGKTCTNPGGGGWGDAPGSFGWLDSSGACSATVDTDGTYDGDTGNNFPMECRAVMESLVDSGETIFMPIYDGVQGSGNNAYYRFKGWAAFVLLGYDLNGGKYGTKCVSMKKPCITGYFTQDLVDDPIETGGPSYGATAVMLSG